MVKIIKLNSYKAQKYIFLSIYLTNNYKSLNLFLPIKKYFMGKIIFLGFALFEIQTFLFKIIFGILKIKAVYANNTAKK